MLDGGERGLRALLFHGAAASKPSLDEAQFRSQPSASDCSRDRALGGLPALSRAPTA